MALNNFFKFIIMRF